MSNLPCIDCICLPVCRKMILDKSPKIGGEIFSKCKLINEYIVIRKPLASKGIILRAQVSINDDKLKELLDYMKNI